MELKRGDPIVNFNSVGLAYDGDFIFKDVTFQLLRGSLYFLTGESGVGKSSLLKLMYLGHSIYEGDIKLFNRNLKTLSPQERPLFRQKIGVVFQDFNLLDHLNALDNVSLPLRILGIPPEQCRARAFKILQWVGLEDHVKAYPKTLSGGQQQRIVIARAVVSKPQLLLADEPTGNVDDKNAVRLIELFEGLHKIGTTVVIATHNRDLVEEFRYPEIHLAHKTLYQDPREMAHHFSGHLETPRPLRA